MLVTLFNAFPLTDKFWYCRLSPNHKVLHYGDLEESPQGEVPHDSLQDKCKSCTKIVLLLLLLCYFFITCSRFLLMQDIINSSAYGDREQRTFPPAFKHCSPGFGKCVLGMRSALQWVYNSIQLGNVMPFMGRNTVYFHCSSNCRCQIKILGHIQKQFLSTETEVSSVANSLVTGGEIHDRQRSFSLSWGVDLKMTHCCEQYWEDFTVTVYPTGRGHASVTIPTGGFVRIFFMDKSNFRALQKDCTVMIISPLSFNTICRGLICSPGKVFIVTEITNKVVLSPESDFKHWIRNNFFLFFSEPSLVINAILCIVKLDTLVQVFQLVAPLLSWNGRKTIFSEVGSFPAWKLRKEKTSDLNSPVY